MTTIYYAQGSNFPYTSKEECLKAEKEYLDMSKKWELQTANAKSDKLIYDLKECLNIWSGTIATCSYDAIRIKHMVGVCQKFIYENEKFLNYY